MIGTHKCPMSVQGDEPVQHLIMVRNSGMPTWGGGGGGGGGGEGLNGG